MTEQPAPLVSVTVAGHGPSLNDRLHPMARYRRNQAMKEAVQWELRAQRAPCWRLRRARLRATLLYSTRRYKDADNALTSCKGAIDGLVAAGILEDDSPAVVEWLPIVQAKSESGGRFTMLEVWSAEEAVPDRDMGTAEAW